MQYRADLMQAHVRPGHLSYARPTRPSEPRYILSGLAAIIVIVGYAVMQPYCRFLFLGQCDTSSQDFGLGLVIFVLGMVLWVLVWTNSARRMRRLGPGQSWRENRKMAGQVRDHNATQIGFSLENKSSNMTYVMPLLSSTAK